MIFNSLHYVIFLPVVVILYYVLPHRLRWMLLLVSSYYFYMQANPWYGLILLFSTVIDYVVSRKMEQEDVVLRRKIYLGISLMGNLGMLFVFKYFDFFSESLSGLIRFVGGQTHLPTLNLLLPVGISFYTFQTLSYTIDVYRKKRKAETHFGYFALYVSFFPQLVAGPIERSERLIPQLKQEQLFSYEKAVNGVLRICFGFFKKVVIADQLAILVNTVFNTAYPFNGFQYVVAIFAFGIQIYCDFSGYSDIAIGSSQLMGIKLMENFRRPYYAYSVGEFWGRWHISLSSWLRDYLTLPLVRSAKNPKSKWVKNYSVLVTFLLCGLWHGARWTFVLWGLIQGIYLVTEKVSFEARKKLTKSIGFDKIPRIHHGLQILRTVILIIFSTLFFRAVSVEQAFYIIGQILTNFGGLHPLAWVEYLKPLGMDQFTMASTFFFVAVLLAVEAYEEFSHQFKKVHEFSRPIRYLIYLLLAATILFFGNFSQNQFVYFVF